MFYATIAASDLVAAIVVVDSAVADGATTVSAVATPCASSPTVYVDEANCGWTTVKTKARHENLAIWHYGNVKQKPFSFSSLLLLEKKDTQEDRLARLL